MNQKIKENKTLPFAYEDFNMSPVTKHPKYRKLYSTYYKASLENIDQFNHKFDSQISKMNNSLKQYTETVDFVQDALETGFTIEYDKNLFGDQNLAIYQT